MTIKAIIIRSVGNLPLEYVNSYLLKSIPTLKVPLVPTTSFDTLEYVRRSSWTQEKSGPTMRLNDLRQAEEMMISGKLSKSIRYAFFLSLPVLVGIVAFATILSLSPDPSRDEPITIPKLHQGEASAENGKVVSRGILASPVNEDISIPEGGSEGRRDDEKEVSRADMISRLLLQLRDKSVDVRHEALDQLWEIEPLPSRAVPALAKALRDGDAWLRLRVTFLLQESAPRARAAIPALKDALNDDEPSIQFSAAQALIAMKFEPIQFLSTFIDVLGKIPNPGTPLNRNRAGIDCRGGAVECIRNLCPDAACAIPALLAALQDNGLSCHGRIIDTFVKIGGEEGLQALIAATRIESSNSRIFALIALAKMGKDAKPAIPAIIELLGHRDRMLVVAASRALLHIESGAPELSEVLAGVLKDGKVYLAVSYTHLRAHET